MLPCSGGCHSSQWSLCYCIYPLIRLVAAGPCVRLRVLSVARPGIACWQHHSADVRRRGGCCKVLFVSVHQMLDVFNNKSHVLGRLLKLDFVCFQRKVACHTTNRPSPPPVATAPLARPPPRARQGRARPKVRDSHSSGPPQSTLNSWGPTDRDSSLESYVSKCLCYSRVLPARPH